MKAGRGGDGPFNCTVVLLAVLREVRGGDIHAPCLFRECGRSFTLSHWWNSWQVRRKLGPEDRSRIILQDVLGELSEDLDELAAGKGG